jgi:tetratricopeptide (TPR) repeat protein
MIYLSNERVAPADVNEINSLFAEIDNYTALIATNSKRPIDYFGRAMNYITLKDYDNAIADLDKAIDLNDKFTVAYMARAYAKQCRLERDERVNQMEQRDDKDKEGSGMLLQQSRQVGLAEILSDYDKVLQLNPGLIYAWYNKGNIMLSIGDLTSALQCYSEAIRISPTFGQAYYNRGLVYLQLGNKASGVADLSKAGELGVLPSYNVLKRMQ